MIPAFEVSEAAKIVKFVADELLATSNQKTGRQGADLRHLCGDMKAHAEDYIVSNVIAAKLQACYTQARETGATMIQFDQLRKALIAIPKEMTVWENDTYYWLGQIAEDQVDRIAYQCRIANTSASTGTFAEDRAAHSDAWGHALPLIAILIRNSCVNLCLQQIAMVITRTDFTSRDDVDRLREEIHPAFYRAAEVAADEMVLDVYRAIIGLHSSLTLHLYETARPLPQILDYEFNASRPTLIQSYRLYATAARADEIRKENKIVHPAFPPSSGRAMAF